MAKKRQQEEKMGEDTSVELSPEEQAEAEAAQRAAEEAEAEEKRQAEAADRKANPKNWIGCVTVDDNPSYFKNISAPVRDRTVIVGGARYEHVFEDADGVWIYRNVGR